MNWTHTPVVCLKFYAWNGLINSSQSGSSHQSMRHLPYSDCIFSMSRTRQSVRTHGEVKKTSSSDWQEDRVHSLLQFSFVTLLKRTCHRAEPVILRCGSDDKEKIGCETKVIENEVCIDFTSIKFYLDSVLISCS